MGVSGEKPQAQNAAGGGDENNDSTPPFLKFCRWVTPSIKNPDNFPHYLISAFTLGLAVFAFFAWIESRHGTQALEGQLKSMQEDQRPYVWITNDPIGLALNIPSGMTVGQIGVTMKYTNYGRGVAYKFDRRLFIKVKSGAYERSAGDIATPMEGKGTGIIPPGKTDFVTAASGPTVSQLDLDWMTRTDFSLGVVMDFEYFDGYGTKFTDLICTERLASGAMAYRNPTDCKH